MDIYSRKKGIIEVLMFFIPVLIFILGIGIAIYDKNFDFLVNCLIGSHAFLALFIWRLCAWFYYKELSELAEENDKLRKK